MNCKEKLLKKLEEKLEFQNNDIILQSLYILCNISTGNEQHKNLIFETIFIHKILKFLVNL